MNILELSGKEQKLLNFSEKPTFDQTSSIIFCTSILYKFHSDVVKLSHSHLMPLPAVVAGLYIFRRTFTNGKSKKLTELF